MVDYRMIPGWVTQEIALWVQFGQPPGSFVQAVLLNDLADAFGKASEAEIGAMHSIVSYVYNEVPSLAWRTEERIRAWAEQGGLEPADREMWVEKTRESVELHSRMRRRLHIA